MPTNNQVIYHSRKGLISFVKIRIKYEPFKSFYKNV